MAIRSDADLDFMLQDAGIPVVSAQSSTYGILRVVDAIEQTDGQPMQKRITTLTVRTGTIIDLAVDLPVTAGGTSYVVRDPNLESDGQLTKIHVAAVTS